MKYVVIKGSWPGSVRVYTAKFLYERGPYSELLVSGEAIGEEDLPLLVASSQVFDSPKEAGEADLPLLVASSQVFDSPKEAGEAAAALLGAP